jgi:flagellar assembly protein FliH
MALEKPIIKRDIANKSTFEFKPREITQDISHMARSFVDADAAKSPDFKISELTAQQTGIYRLEHEAQKDQINALVLEKLKEVQESAYKEGHELGLIEGTEKAFQDSKADFVIRLERFDDMLKQIEILKGKLMMENEAELIRLVFLTAKKIAMRDLEEHRGAVVEILSAVVGEMQADERVSIKISPEDLLFLESLQDKINKRIQNFDRLKFVSDDKVKPGGCLIETEYGTVDATVDERVERTWQTLLGRVPRSLEPKKE